MPGNFRQELRLHHRSVWDRTDHALQDAAALEAPHIISTTFAVKGHCSCASIAPEIRGWACALGKARPRRCAMNCRGWSLNVDAKLTG